MEKTAHDIQLKELKDTVKELRETIAVLNKTIAEGEKEKKVLREQIDFLTKKLFGTSSEKRNSQIEGQLSLFNEAEAEQDSGVLEGQLIREHTRKKKATNEEKFKDIPSVREVIELPEEERICAICGTHLEIIGYEHIRDEIEFTPATVKKKELVRAVYGCPACKQEDEANIAKPDAPAPLMDKSFATPFLVAWVMYLKYVNAVPLYRQERDWLQYGLHVSRTTLANCIIRCSAYFRPLYEFYHRKLLERWFLMADETRVQVLKEPGKRAQSDSFMWLYRTGEDDQEKILLYEYTPTRNGDNAVSFLTGFKGYLMTEGFAGYNKLPDVTHCCCMAHVRRKFFDAIPDGPKNDHDDPAVQGVMYCDKLFRIEEEMKRKGMNADERTAYRKKHAEPVIDAFCAWLDKQMPIEKSGLAKAVTYAQNRRPYMKSYLEDGLCSLSNNLSENAIRPFAVGRRNWLFSDTVKGAQASATIYTIVEMAKAHDVNIYHYLAYVLEQRPDMDWTDEQLDKISPWNEELKEIIKDRARTSTEPG